MSFALPSTKANFHISSTIASWKLLLLPEGVLLWCLSVLLSFGWLMLYFLVTIFKTVMESLLQKKKKKKHYFLLPQLVNAENQAIGAMLLPACERMRCEGNTWSSWRAITASQDQKAHLLLRSELPTGSNKKQIFVSKTPLVFNYSHLHLLLTFFQDETLYLTTSIPSSGLWQCLCVLNPRYSRKWIPLQVSFCSALCSSKRDLWEEISKLPTSLNIIATTIPQKHIRTHLSEWSQESCIHKQNIKVNGGWQNRSTVETSFS